MSAPGVVTRVSEPRSVVPFPAPPLVSSRDLAWPGLLVERYQYPGAKYALPALPVHSLVLQLGPPLRMAQQRDGKLHDEPFLTHQLALIPAGLANTCWHTEPVDAAFISLDPHLVTQTAATIGVDPNRVEVVNNFSARDPQLQAVTLALLQEVKAPGLGGRLYVDSLTTQLVVHVLRFYSALTHPLPEAEGRGLAAAHLQRALTFIHDQLAEELSLADIAASVHLSPYHFARLFKQSVGLTPHQYVVSQRVEAAKRLLANADVTTAQVAAEVGFSDYSHLARHFKRLVGLPPAEFQRRKNLHTDRKIVHDSAA
jgi:AraC family transcriptional regulator